MPILTTFTVEGRNAIPFLKDQTLEIEPQLNGRMVATASFVDRLDRPNPLADIFRPEKRDVFLIEFDDGRRFGGIIWDLDRTHVAPGMPDAGLHTFARMVDYNALLDVVYFNEPVAGGSLESQLEAVMDNMTPHGVTLSGSQQTGPTLGNQVFEWRTIRQIIDTYSLQSGWVERVNADGEIEMIDPGSLVAATPISEALGNYRSMKFSDSLSDYRNEAWIRFGPHGVLPVTEVFTGDGSTRTFRLGYHLSDKVVVTTTGIVTVTRAGPVVTEETIDADPIAGTDQWHYDQAETWNNAIVHDAGETVLAVGETVSITYYAFFPGAVFARDSDEYAEHGPWTTVIDRPDITDRTIAQTEAEAEVARISGDNGRLTIEVLDGAEYEVGQTIEVDAPVLGLTEENMLITEIRMIEAIVQASTVRTYIYILTAIQGNVYRENWRAFWRQVRGEEGTGGTPTLEEECVELWSDDFNSGAALSDDYVGILDVAKTAGIGPDASQGVETTDSLGVFRKEGLAATGRTGSLRFDSKTIDPDEDFYVAEVRRSGAWIISIYRNDDPGSNELQVYFRNTVSSEATVSNFWDDTTYHSYMFEWVLSTFNGVDYDADGEFRAYKDGALAVNLTGVEIFDDGWDDQTWDQIALSPQGHMDNLVICDNA
jgi:hypothetical protein